MQLNTLVLTAVLFYSTALIAQTPPEKVVSVAQVQQQVMLPHTMVTAQVQSRYQADVSAGVEGRLLWLAEPGAQIKQDEVIARLDITPLQLRVDEMNARISRADIQWRRLQKDTARLSELSKNNSVALTQLDQISAERDSAEAELKLLRAQLAQLQDQINRSSVKAPFAGVVAQRFHQHGEDISRTDALVRLVNLNDLEVVVFAPLKYAAFLQHNQLLQVFHSGGESQLPVRNLIPVSDMRSQTFEARIKVPQQLLANFQVGQLVSVAVPTALARQQLLVPRDAVVVKSEGQFVFVVDHEQKAQQKAVLLGQGMGKLIAVDAELSAGEHIVIRGGDTLTQGDKVKVLTDQEFPVKT
ncbi:MAG: efflux RND transporter periplasmic adaptor subunit [Gammaproteobacteria bacterium]|nr:efflux RND transporter periplasmic adaptor subunit [Gammaproteobacteria bacterium]MBU2059110.1 efflux RND transporter periplasmic adaptor subunit [Gammaproteobacteria bacterium]MBU2173661.1 efflux RND transporter periplasmic adaptor subunit [Gammaproteobacteria bacterium]MBU2246817.1 efflux RND transporter periplasmic adaptor subunit [Gammaproteobacteria bacterium]MBU2343809.1 efflux RND transporter periplasmic adaptor subunit [Gammaproteobacteria bacterium]